MVRLIWQKNFLFSSHYIESFEINQLIIDYQLINDKVIRKTVPMTDGFQNSYNCSNESLVAQW